MVLAIEEEAAVDIMCVCGSYAGCISCRVEYLEGEEMTQAEPMIVGSTGPETPVIRQSER